MDMFDKKSINERIGNIQKSSSLNHLKEVEKYFLSAVKPYKLTVVYDTVSNEIPYFKTINYTEWAHTFIIHPLNLEIRVKQMMDAYKDDAPQSYDYITYFKERILGGDSNKYTHINSAFGAKGRENLVVLVGSDKVKERICLNKLKWIKNTYEGDVYFKPHPFTTHAVIGELKDIFGNDTILDRETDLYHYLIQAKRVYTSHMSESAMYAVALGKIIEPIDVYQTVEQGSFYHINKFLFNEENPQEWANRTFNSPKSGIINPEIDPKWREKIDMYLEYLANERNKHKNKYV